MTSIGGDAFGFCTSLTSINIPQGVTSIDAFAFWGCTSLTSISIPQGVSYLGDEVFSCCTSLMNITVDANNLKYASKDGVLFNKAGTILIECAGGLTSISIPQGVIDIAARAFEGCTGLTNINIPESVTNIGECAFWECTGLTRFTVSNDNSNFGSIDGVLYNKAGNILIACTGDVTSFSIPKGVTSIGLAAFSHCTGLTSIRFNSATTTIGDVAFTIPTATKIIGYDPSAAKDYATKYGRTFEVIDSTNTLQ